MSFYNSIYGFNQACFFFLPMLGRQPDEYPRFRDCFTGKVSRSENKDGFGIPILTNDDSELISIFMRIGGGNREGYQDAIEDLRNIPEYIEDYDDSFDSTFALFVFSVPEKWKEDYKRIYRGALQEVSDEYLSEMKRIFPKLADKYDMIFRKI